MSRTPGRPTHEPEGEDAILKTDEVELGDLGRKLIDLGERLQKLGTLTEKKQVLERGVIYVKNEHEELTEREVELEIADARFAMRETLKGLRDFRREYDYWERVVAEFALNRMGYTQRDAALLLGVSVSTINRWAQNPLKIEDLR
jgi:Trp operon repressor